MKDLTDQLKAWDIGQTELAHLLDRDPRTVRKWCAGPPPVIVSALLQACRELEPADPKRALTRLLESVRGKKEEVDGNA